MTIFSIEWTDTYGGEANYCWVDRFEVEADTIKQAITKAKKHRYFSPLPKHKIDFNDGDQCRFDIVGAPVCCFVQFKEQD